MHMCRAPVINQKRRLGRPDWLMLSRRRSCGGERFIRSRRVPRPELDAATNRGYAEDRLMALRRIASGGYVRFPVLLMKSLIVMASRSSTMVTSPRATKMPAT